VSLTDLFQNLQVILAVQAQHSVALPELAATGQWLVVKY
jgi:hypothetical protein